MRDVSKSLNSLCWATSIFGAQQMADVLCSADETRAERSAYVVKKALQQQFSSNPLYFALDQLGDGVQQQAVDFVWDWLRLKPLDPRWLGRLSGNIFQRSIGLISALTPGDNLQNTWAILRNTLQVLSFVNDTAAGLDSDSQELNLADEVDRAYAAGGNYEALWLIEGLGEEYADRNWVPAAPVRGLLSAGSAVQLPARSMLMLHAGMGIAFARRTANALTPYSSEAEFTYALKQFIRLVGDNARQGYEGPVYESLGLVTRSWYPELLAAIDRALWGIDVNVLEYFWHGVGRAVYFSPQYLIPGASAFCGIGSEAPHQLAFENGTAGVAWAFTLVNIRQPEILLHLVKNLPESFTRDGAFTSGVISTCIMALDTLPDDPNVHRLCCCQPLGTDSGLTAEWERLVRGPCNRAVDYYYPLLKSRGQLSEIFRYRDPQALLAGTPGAAQ